jgi:hypothetical protein
LEIPGMDLPEDASVRPIGDDRGGMSLDVSVVEDPEKCAHLVFNDHQFRHVIEAYLKALPVGGPYWNMLMGMIRRRGEEEE